MGGYMKPVWTLLPYIHAGMKYYLSQLAILSSWPGMPIHLKMHNPNEEEKSNVDGKEGEEHSDP